MSKRRTVRRVGRSRVAVMCTALLLSLCASPVSPQEIPFAPYVPGSLDGEDTLAPTVPDVIGDRLETAVGRLGDRDLESKVMQGPAHDPAAVVVGQDPPGGASPPRDRIVRLWLAREQRLLEVPHVIGELLGDAERIIAERELSPELVGAATPPDVRVIRQEPEPGARVEPRHPVRVWVEDWVTVPDLWGLPMRQATQELQHLDLEGHVVEGPAYDPSALVVGQDPPGGTRLPRGRIVRLWLQEEPRLIEVPHVIGEPLGEAVRAIKARGLRPELMDREAGPSAGVIRQEPEGGARVAPGSTVSLDVRPRTELVQVPGVVDLDRKEAFRRIHDALLVPRLSPNSAQDHGRVIRQQPIGGVQAHPGDQVLLWLAPHRRPQCGPSCVALIVLALSIVGPGVWLWLRGSGRPERKGRRDKHDPESMAFEDNIGELRMRVESPLRIGTEIRLEPVLDIEGNQTLDAPGNLVIGWEELR